jgi:hypothetical protein
LQLSLRRSVDEWISCFPQEANAYDPKSPKVYELSCPIDPKRTKTSTVAGSVALPGAVRSCLSNVLNECHSSGNQSAHDIILIFALRAQKRRDENIKWFQ